MQREVGVQTRKRYVQDQMVTEDFHRPAMRRIFFSKRRIIIILVVSTIALVGIAAVVTAVLLNVIGSSEENGTFRSEENGTVTSEENGTFRSEENGTVTSEENGTFRSSEENGTSKVEEGEESQAYEAMSDRQKYFFNLGVRLDKDIQDCKSGELKYSFPNLDYAFLGYDILRGYPLAESHDPGLTNPIFAADYSMNVQSADCRFALPNGVLVIPDVSCVTSFSSTEITNEKELAESLAVSAEISGGGYGAAFSASAGYKQAKSSIEKENSVLITSTARCDYYFVKLQKESPPAFHSTFLKWLPKLDRLDELIDKNEYKNVIMEFFDKFGTHYLTEVTFGARFTYEHKMQQSSYQQISSSSMSASVRASYSGAFSVGGGFSLDNEQRDAALEFSKSVTTRTVTVGAAPPSNGDALTWASTVQNNPVPTKYKLSPIEDIFVSDYMHDTGIDYDEIRNNIIKYKEFYQEYRKKKEEEILQTIHSSSSTTSTRTGNWRVHKILAVEGGHFGDWKKEEFCPPGMYAIGYNLKIEADVDGDDTGLNAVKLYCADSHGEKNGDVITSGQQKWGTWASQDAMCQIHERRHQFLNQFSLQFYDLKTIAAVFIRFHCQDLNQESNPYRLAVLPGENTQHGRFWHESQSCPEGTAICGIKTKIEKELEPGRDDTALNNVKLYCCGY